MAQNSFDISTGVDLQEVDNAVNMALKEIATRYDFKGSSCTLDFDRKAGAVKLDADDEYRLKALLGVLREKLARRSVPLKNLDEGKVEVGSLGRARQTLKDTKIMLAQAQAHGQRLEVLEVYSGMLQACVDAGEGDLDNCVIINEVRRRGTPRK